MKILALGGGGFIGSHLVDRLCRSTQHVLTSFDRTHDKLIEADPPRERLTILDGDLRKSGSRVRDLVREADLVIDLIAYATPSMYVANPLEVVDLNYNANLEVVTACAEAGKHLIQFSSCEVYGPTLGRQEPFSEDQSALIMGPIRESRWIYATAKQLLERVVHAYATAGQLTYTIIRPFNFLGPRFDYLPPPGSTGGPRVFAHFMSALLSGGPMQLVDGGEAQRTYTDIRDAVAGICIAIDGATGQFRNQIVNVGYPGNETTIRNLAHEMCAAYEELVGRKAVSEIVSVPGEKFYGPGYADCDRRIPDATKLLSAGWVPRYKLRETLRYAMGYYVAEKVEVKK
jgi:UDP-apiose/xylose synthase